ncbi:hypothetical protein V1264_021022 [Littorina saxatilis]|uniref:Integrase catalytic domain-containing protein n=1 Tax=Littorina saxatilis TaxID=31220 RepID=A0AAN9GC78_9CAEN
MFVLNDQQYLTVVDYYSRWVEIAHLKQTTSPAVIENLKSIFARQSIPEVVVSDNGPQYDSRDFVKFAESYGFTHITSSPHHPQSNGEAERAVQTVKNLLKKAKDPYIALLNYRATPLQQGESPAELLMGRKLRNKIPTHPSSYVPRQPDRIQFRERDARLKAQQKDNYDKRHRARALSPLPPGQRVWMRTPGTNQAVVTATPSPSSPRSYPVQTNAGTNTRRNRRQLRRRSNQPQPEGGIPRSTSTLPWSAPQMPVQQSEESSFSDTRQQTCDIPNAAVTDGMIKTRSGRLVKPRERLDL